MAGQHSTAQRESARFDFFETSPRCQVTIVLALLPPFFETLSSFGHRRRALGRATTSLPWNRVTVETNMGGVTAQQNRHTFHTSTPSFFTFFLSRAKVHAARLSSNDRLAKTQVLGARVYQSHNTALISVQCPARLHRTRRCFDLFERVWARWRSSN